jgi:hypothetical protein
MRGSSISASSYGSFICSNASRLNGMTARDLTLIQQPHTMRDHWDERAKLVPLREQFGKVPTKPSEHGHHSSRVNSYANIIFLVKTGYSMKIP